MPRMNVTRPPRPLRIRLAEEPDAPAIAAIYAPIVTETTISFEEEPPDAVEMARRIREGRPLHPWLVAEDPTSPPGPPAIAGYAAATPFRSRPAYRWAVETSVYVAAERRRRGVASALYRRLLARLAAQGFRRAVAGVTLPNDPSLAFHRRHGFRPLGTGDRIGWKHGRWLDVAWLQRDLGTGPVDRPPDGDPRPLVAEDVDPAGGPDDPSAAAGATSAA